MAMPTLNGALAKLAATGLEELEDEYSITGYYRPYAGVTAAQSLRWVGYDKAVSAVRGLLGATYDDLKRRVEIGEAVALLHPDLLQFFGFDGISGSRSSAPFALYGRFPDQDFYVCADRPLLAVKRAMNLVAASEASQDACNGYYHAVGELMRLLVGDAGPAPLPGTVLFDQVVFESTFRLEWVPY